MAQDKNITNAFDKEDIEKNKVMAGLGYIIFFLPLIVMKDSKFARFHANQILLLLIPSVVISVVGTIISSLLMGTLHMGLAAFVGFLLLVVELLVGIIAIINMVAAFQGKAKRIPVIGGMSIIKDSNNMDAEDMFQNETLNRMSENFQNLSFDSVVATCENCGNKMLSGKKFCSKCGTPVPEIKKEKKMPTKKCENCGCVVDEKTKFCSECGMPIPEKKEPEPIKCLNCGNLLDEKQKFCPECGTPVKKNEKIDSCPNCHIRLKEGIKFCPECGTKIMEE